MIPLKLTRDQLAKFLPDFETIRKFEKLFGYVEEIAPNVVEEIKISTSNAVSRANQALAMLASLYAKDIKTDPTNFNNILSATDTDVQKALETLDDMLFKDISDTISAYTANRILYESGAGIVDSANFTFDGSKLSVIGGVINKTSTKIADYTVTDADHDIIADGSSNTVTITLPASPNSGQIFNIACLDSTFTVDIDLNGKNLYDDPANIVLFKGENISLKYDGTQWVGA